MGWTRLLALALDDFFGDVADALRDAIAEERAPRPKPHTAKRGRSPEQREAIARTERVTKAWRTLETIAGNSPTHPTIENARTLVRKARFRAHPDRKPGKSSRDFLRVQRAAEILSTHYGVTL